MSEQPTDCNCEHFELPSYVRRIGPCKYHAELAAELESVNAELATWMQRSYETATDLGAQIDKNTKLEAELAAALAERFRLENVASLLVDAPICSGCGGHGKRTWDGREVCCGACSGTGIDMQSYIESAR